MSSGKNEENEFRVVDRRASSGAQEEAKPQEKEGSGFVMKDKPEEGHELEQIDFATFVFSLATGALIHLGVTPDPSTQKTQKNVELAKQNIDILGLLQEKTKGNLTSEESGLLEGLLSEVRLRYVQEMK